VRLGGLVLLGPARGVGRAGLLAVRGGQSSLVERLLVGARLGNLEGALGALLALELLPVAGHLQQGSDLLGRLRADGEPVLRTLGVDLDERGLLGGDVAT